MGLTGKYDFDGIKKANALGLRALLLSFKVTAWITKLPLFGPLSELLGNLMANKGLVFLNNIASHVNGHFDQQALDDSIEAGLKRLERAAETGETITPEEGKAIDDAVIKAADKAIPYGKPPKPKS